MGVVCRFIIAGYVYVFYRFGHIGNLVDLEFDCNSVKIGFATWVFWIWMCGDL